MLKIVSSLVSGWKSVDFLGSKGEVVAFESCPSYEEAFSVLPSEQKMFLKEGDLILYKDNESVLGWINHKIVIQGKFILS